MAEDFFDPVTETIEDLGRKGFRLIQRKDGFRFGEDTVLLAYYAAEVAPKFKRGTKALDLGAGCGASGVLLAARRPDVRIDGIEIDAASFNVFSRNVRMNGLIDRVRPIQGDIRDFPDARNVLCASYDFVFFNPPYGNPNRGPVTQPENKTESLRNARFEINGRLVDFFKTAADALRPGGIMAMVHRSVRLPEAMRVLLENGLQPIGLRMIHPRADARATAFLLSARKGGKPGGFFAEAPLILRNGDMIMTEEMNRIYTDGE